jgi:hypothetical protein
MKNSRQLRKVKRVQAKADWKARIKALDIDDCRPYVVGAHDPITGRPQGPNIDLMTPEQREAGYVCEGVTNAQYRSGLRRLMTRVGLPPVGLFAELTPEERNRFFAIRDEREKLDLPCSVLTPTVDHIKQCTEWHGKVQRGEMTREEYHRLARAMIGLPEEEAQPSSSGDSAEIEPAESPASPAREPSGTS